jgi:molybdate transport repressor ModE-like protein
MQINNLNIVPDWRLEDLQGQKLHVSFLPLLSAIHRTKKLTIAAQQCELSYRHAWNILRQADSFFGQAVTVMERGKGASLTPLGSVLMQANQRVEARLHAQMESLTMELNSEVHRVLADQIRAIPIFATHGYAVAMIPDYLRGFQAEMHYHGPEDALRGLKSGNCMFAGFNMPLHHRIASQQQRYPAYLRPKEVKILSFIKRQQGLMFTAENASKVRSLSDLQDSSLRFINRQPRSGTRELFDKLLDDARIGTESVRGYDNHEYTHSAVAAHVATGMAEVGFGVKAAATRFELDFIPLTEDRYFWAYEAERDSSAEVTAFKEMLATPEYQAEINRLPGYQCDRCGEPILAKELLG